MDKTSVFLVTKRENYNQQLNTDIINKIYSVIERFCSNNTENIRSVHLNGTEPLLVSLGTAVSQNGWRERGLYRK